MKVETYSYAKRTRLVQHAWLILIACIFSGSLAFGQSRGVQPSYSGAEANKRISGAEFIREGRNTPYPSFVRMSESSHVSVDQFAPWIISNLKLPAGSGFRLLKQEEEKGLSTYRFQQTHLSLPMDGAEYVVNASGGRILWITGKIYQVPRGLNATPALDESQALTAAMNFIGAKQYKWQSEFWTSDLRRRTGNPNATYVPQGTLCWVNTQPANNYILAWRFDIWSADPDKLQRVFIDAKTGAGVKELPMESNCSAHTAFTSVYDGTRYIRTDNYSGSLYRLRNDCQGAIFHVRDWNSTTTTESPLEIENTANTWNHNFNEKFGATVLWLVDTAYRYWLGVHSLNSYDGAGGDVDGYINAIFSCTGPPDPCYTEYNASMSFSGGRLKVGAGGGGTDVFATLDIIGHEFTHAVTASSSGLVYQDESGALNESFSDIFGEAIENYARGSNDWLLGDDRSSGAIRDMSNPKAMGQPDTYLKSNWYTGSADNGGVHTNSGVQNYWFYLLVNGGTGQNDYGDNYTVSGVGLAVASFLAYQNQKSLGSDATYPDSRDNAIAKAAFYYGACSNVTKQVTNAWYAVGVGDPFFDATAVVTSDYHGRDVSCHDVCDGAATVNVVSGVLPSYNWDNGAAFTKSVSGLCPGLHTVVVTNSTIPACSVTRSVTIQNTPLLVTNPAATTNYNGYNISCNGAHDGAAAANAAGGTAPYTYDWNTIPVQHGATATNLGAGTYTVTVTDANGCTASKSVTLTEPPKLTATASPTTNYNGFNVRCNGGSDGEAEAYPAGGVPPYSYSWNTVPVQTTKHAVNLSAQMYTVNVTDLNGCGTSASTTLTEPPVLTIDAGANKTVYYGYPDSACTTLNATGIGGGVPPYTLHWSNGPNTASNTVCPITSTTYYVTVTDKNGCTMTDSVRVCVIDVRCGNHLDKVELCHNTGSAKNPTQTLCVALSGAITHIAHGDQLAACGTIKTCNYNTAKMVHVTGEIGNPELTAYPNPFGDYTNIRFMVPTEQKVALALFDVSGRKVATIFDGIAKAEVTYVERLEGSSLPAGMYFLTMKLENGESITGKLVLTR